MNQQEPITILNYQSSSVVNPYTDIISRDLVYSDLDLRMKTHPINNTLNILEDVEAVKRALINLMMTEPGDKPFDPNYGTPLNGMLFNFMNLNPFDLEDQIKRSIRLYEPRVRVTNVSINDQRDKNSIGVTIEFQLVNINSNNTFTVQLKRLR